MSASKASRPAFCPFIYHDSESLYLEFEGQVLRFTYTEAGLHKALKHIPNIASQKGFLTGRSNIINKVLPKLAPRTRHKREVRNFTPEQRARALEIIRKLRAKV